MNSEENPFFSIIIPTYNRAWILGNTIQQILDQDFSDWELIIVDDGSKDNTKEVIEGLQKGDQRIQYIYQDNARQAAARQNGLDHAKGEWVAYIDSDETIYPYYLSVAKEFFDTNSGVWYAFAYNDRTLELQDKDRNILSVIEQKATDLPLHEITLQSYAHWEIKPCGTGIFHKREIINETISWDTTFKLFEDIDFVFQLGVKYPEHFGFIQTPIFHQRQIFGTEGVCSNASYEDWANGFEYLYKKYKGTWLMEGQQWYPKKVERYRERQELFKRGEFPSPVERIFEEYYSLK